MPPVQVWRRYGEGELREPAQERLEGDVALDAGQRRTETVMDAVPEREVTGLLPVEVELSGLAYRSASRFAAARQMMTCSPAGIATSPSVTGAAVYRNVE